MTPQDIPAFNAVVTELEQRTKDFIERGYFLDEIDISQYGDVTPSKESRWGSPAWTAYRSAYRKRPKIVRNDASVRGYLRDVAKQMKRPFIEITYRYLGATFRPIATIYIPKQTRTFPLWGAWQLIDKNSLPESQWGPVHGPEKYMNLRVTAFDAKQQLDALLEQWHADPDCRKALGLPPLTHGVST